MQKELGIMEDIMAWLYDEMILIEKVMDPLIDIHKKAREVLKLLNVARKSIDHLQEWDSKCLNVVPQLVIMDRITVEMD